MFIFIQFKWYCFLDFSFWEFTIWHLRVQPMFACWLSRLTHLLFWRDFTGIIWSLNVNYEVIRKIEQLYFFLFYLNFFYVIFSSNCSNTCNIMLITGLKLDILFLFLILRKNFLLLIIVYWGWLWINYILISPLLSWSKFNTHITANILS